MPTPSRSDAYPTAMTVALEHALTHGSLLIPSDKPHALRLQFYGLKSALRKEGKNELIETITFVIAPGGLLLRTTDMAPFAKDIEAALKAAGNTTPTNPVDAAEESLKRLGF